MSEIKDLLTETASRLFAKACTRELMEEAERGVWPQSLWAALDEAGLTAAARSEDRGGSGADLADLGALVRTIGRTGAPVPLVETLLAERMLAAAGLPCVDGVATVGPVVESDHLSLRRDGNDWMLSGTAHRVPWARNAAAVVALAASDDLTRTVVVRNPTVSHRDSNYAGEPRDTLSFDAVRVAAADVSEPGGFDRQQLQLAGALFRAVAMTGALETALALTVKYAQERVQFGRPIGKFQAVQQQIAVLASQVAAAVVAAQGAIDAAAKGAAAFEIAAAKTRIGEAAGVAAAIAHQVHGAMGFTHEHSLQLSTRRLWAWRDEFGSECEWAEWIGKAVAKVGSAGLWAYVTNPDPAVTGVPAT